MPANPARCAGNVASGAAKVSADRSTPTARGRRLTVTHGDPTGMERILGNSFLAAEDPHNDENAKDHRWCVKKMY